MWELLLAEADVAALGKQIELALFMDAKARRVESPGEMRARTHFAHRIDMLDATGESPARA